MTTIIYNANVVLQYEIAYGYLIIESDKICEIGKGYLPQDKKSNNMINARGKYLSPGFVELHTHGAGGADFMDGDVTSFLTAANTHMKHGTTSLLPTTLAANKECTLLCIKNYIEAKKIIKNGPNLLGLHMEGPYLNPTYKGAMDEKSLRNPDPAEYKFLIEKYPNTILRWTIAPELPGAMEMGRYLKKHGICVSIGHSAAEYETVKEAFYNGFTHITHLYSAMSTITRRGGFRFSGVQESALIINGLTVELIADGCHIPIELLNTVWRYKGPENIALTCDSMRCAGTDEKESFLGSKGYGIPVIIEDDVAKLLDKSGFGGSIATDDRLVRTMYHSAKIPLVDCIKMMCLTPSRIIGVEREKGSIDCGKDADLIIFDENIVIERVLVGGKTTYLNKNK
ncbi:MAG: N-acetylglucosamine-6-phosphate deacetylase [Lachnospirales bacterium]